MAKIRVYELAKDLNMTNKALLEKIKDLDIEAKSHMSSLEDDDAQQIKDSLFKKEGSDQNKEIRVKATVIRRRRKKTESTELEEMELEQDQVDETEAKSLSDDESAAEQENGQQDVSETDDVQEEKIFAEEMTTETIQPEIVESPEKEIIITTTVAEETVVSEKETGQAKEELPSQTAKDAPVDAIEGSEASLPIKQDMTVAEGPEEDAAPKHKKAKQKKKKKGQQTAAKIIKLPDFSTDLPLPEEIVEEAQSLEDNSPIIIADEKEPVQEKTEDLSDKARKKGKKSTKIIDPEKDKKFFKKKTAFRKKEVIEGDDLYSEARIRKGKKKGSKTKIQIGQKTQITTPKAIKRRVKIDDTIILSELAKRMGIKANEMIQKLMSLGVMATVNQTIDYDTAVLVAGEFEYEVERASFEEEIIIAAEDDKAEDMSSRPPVVTIMGHVDHGKTSLLDVIRKTRVADGEAGGITQHIGAYNVTTSRGQVVFLDTPGHEAFTAMRSRGAKITDIVVLVVAADDGVMPQTIEAINHSKAAGVPIIVAVNKIDKDGAEPDRIKRELSDHGILAEDWGGSTIFVNVSAKKNIGIDSLLEMILLQSEMLELSANPNKLARGHVVEAKLDTGRGPVATVLVQTGTLKNGQSVVCGIHYGKIRAMLNDKGQQLKEAGPSMPVEILGLTGVPEAGDEMISLTDEKAAKQVSAHRIQKQRSLELAKSSRLSLEGLFEQMKEGEVKDLNIIIRADVHGSIEALKESLTKLSTSEVKINIVHAATGTITESDISLATVSNAIVIGFNVRPGSNVHDMANEEHVDMRFYSVIYDVIQDVKDAMVGMMASTYEENILGRAEVREVFVIPKKGTVAGSYVTDGKVERGCKARLLRDGIIIFDGNLSSLRRFKDDAKEVASGYECGIGIENFNDIKVGDIIECYLMKEIKPHMA
ncbi:MAG: translation initiation factor IF-2 [Proteobacteria bacterium]|nr:translation initiation factor IF-2 [Pseudomonadota bacterium]